MEEVTLRLHLKKLVKVFFTVGAVGSGQVTSAQKRIYLTLFFSVPQLQEEAEAEEEDGTRQRQKEEGVLGDNVSQKVVRITGGIMFFRTKFSFMAAKERGVAKAEERGSP